VKKLEPGISTGVPRNQHNQHNQHAPESLENLESQNSRSPPAGLRR
jgi:hypothetical protein